MAGLPQARVAHLAARRLRLKIRDKRGDQGFFQAVAKELAGWDSVAAVETNPLTGSVLVHFTELAALFAENAIKNRLFAVGFDELLDAPDAPVPELAEWAGQQVAAVDGALRRWTGGAGDIRNLMFLFLVAASAVQLWRGNIAAPAATLLWYAGAILRLWHVAPQAKDTAREG